MKTVKCFTCGRDVLLDDVDYEWASKLVIYHSSGMSPRPSLRFNSTEGSVSLARTIINLWDRTLVPDHIDRDIHNNQSENLRPATYSQNNQNRKTQRNNTSGFVGVIFHSKQRFKNWQARINVNGERISLKYYDTPEEAAKAYDKAAIKHFGPHAKLNFPNEHKQ